MFKMATSGILLGIALILFVVLGGKIFRTVKARDISGVVVMGDVHGDVNLTQKPEPPAEPPKPPAWRDILTLANTILGLAASALVIASLELD